MYRLHHVRAGPKTKHFKEVRICGWNLKFISLKGIFVPAHETPKFFLVILFPYALLFEWFSVLWKQLAPWALTLWEWNHACGSACLRVFLKFKTLNPRGWFFSQQLVVCTLCKPNQSCPWFQTKSAWCLPRHPPKKCPPAPSPLRIIATKAEKLLLSPHLLLFCLLTCVGGGGCFFSSWRRTRWGRRREMGGNFFWEKLHSRGLRQEQGENYGSTESQSQYKKRSFLSKKVFQAKKDVQYKCWKPLILAYDK